MSHSDSEPEILQGEDLSWDDMCYSQHDWYSSDILDTRLIVMNFETSIKRLKKEKKE